LRPTRFTEEVSKLHFPRWNPGARFRASVAALQAATRSAEREAMKPEAEAGGRQRGAGSSDSSSHTRSTFAHCGLIFAPSNCWPQ
jgi:hypothetical protein